MRRKELKIGYKKHWKYILGVLCASMLMTGCTGSGLEKKKDQLP